MSPTRNDIEQIQFSVPIDKPLSKGFVVSAIIHLLVFLALIAYVIFDPPKPSTTQLPMELIRLGLGNGPGSGGNLSAAGDPQKGETPQNPLEDASRQQAVKHKVDPAQPYETGQRVEVSSVSNARRSKDSLNAHGTHTTGSPNGNPNGTGIAGTGNGPGSGLGFGIDWGGGGNRTVLNKVIPTLPPGCDKNAQITIQFAVQPDGTPFQLIPKQKGDPRMEAAALKALQQWRFSKLNGGNATVQKGEIKMSFKIN